MLGVMPDQRSLIAVIVDAAQFAGGALQRAGLHHVDRGRRTDLGLDLVHELLAALLGLLEGDLIATFDVDGPTTPLVPRACGL